MGRVKTSLLTALGLMVCAMVGTAAHAQGTPAAIDAASRCQGKTFETAAKALNACKGTLEDKTSKRFVPFWEAALACTDNATIAADRVKACNQAVTGVFGGIIRQPLSRDLQAQLPISFKGALVTASGSAKAAFANTKTDVDQKQRFLNQAIGDFDRARALGFNDASLFVAKGNAVLQLVASITNTSVIGKLVGSKKDPEEAKLVDKQIAALAFKRALQIDPNNQAAKDGFALASK